jgi:hypothetical protein
MAKQPKFGATGQFPYGRIGPTDEGELSMGIAVDHEHGIVKLQFGKPIIWLGMPSAHARKLAALLIAKADELDRRKA